MLSEHDNSLASELNAFILHSNGGFFIVESNDATKEREFLSLVKKNARVRSATVDFSKERKPSLFFTRIKQKISQSPNVKVIYICNLYRITANKNNAIKLAQDLNYNRDLYYNTDKIFIFFLPVFFVDIILTHARDFYDYVSSSVNISEGSTLYDLADVSDFADVHQAHNRICFLRNYNHKNRKLTLKEKYEYLNELGSLYLDIYEVNSAISTYKKGIKLAISNNSVADQANFQDRLGYALTVAGKQRASFNAMQKALILYTEINDEINIGRTYNNIAKYYQKKGDVKTAIELLDKSIKIHRSHNNSKGTEIALINLARVLTSDKKYVEALNVTNEILESLKVSGNTSILIKVIQLVGKIQFITGDFKNARFTFEQAIHLAKESNDKNDLAAIFFNISRLHEHLGEYARAKQYLLESLELSQELKNKRAEVLVLRQLSQLLHKTGDLNNSVSFLEKLCILDEELNLNNLRQDKALLEKIKFDIHSQGKFKDSNFEKG